MPQPPLDKRVLPNWIDSFIKFTDNTEPPITYRKWTAISAIASAMQRKCRLNWGHYPYFPNMYIVLVGPSGNRKGTAIGPAYSILQEIGIPMAADATTKEALIRSIADSAVTTTDEESSTIVTHSSLTIVSHEFTVFLGHGDNDFIIYLTDWYDCKSPWVYRTKHQGTDSIIGLWVNILAATTPDSLRSSLPTDAIGGGLTSRMIFVHEMHRGKIVAAPFITKEEEDLRKKLVHDLGIIYTMSGVFTVTENFMGTYTDWYHKVSTNDPFADNPRFAGYSSRRPSHILKLSMIVSAAKNNTMVITEEDFNYALAMLLEVEENMPRTFSGVGQSMTADVTARVMQQIAHRGEVSLRELIQMFYSDADRRTMATIISTLEGMGYCRRLYAKDGSTIITYTESKK